MTATKTFPNISKQAWLQSIKKELKDKSWEDQFFAITEKIHVPPAYHNEEVNNQKWSPVSAHYHPQTVSGINFTTENSAEKNKFLHQALQHGLQAPGIVKCRQDSEEEVLELLHEVHVEMLEWHLFGYDNKDPLVTFLSSNHATYFLHPTPTQSTHTNDRMTRFLKALMSFHRQEELEVLTFHCRISALYLSEICILRAMRRIFENYRRATEKQHLKLYLSTSNSLNPLSKDPYTQMVANSSMAMSAMIGGADRVSLDIFFEENQGLQYRMAINLIQILKMESHLHRVRDPLCGSYWIEKTTDAIAHSYWNKFQSML